MTDLFRKTSLRRKVVLTVFAVNAILLVALAVFVLR